MKTALTSLCLLALLVVPMVAKGTHGNDRAAHWRTGTVRLIDSVTPAWEPELTTAAAAWNAGLTQIETVVEAGKSRRSIRKRCPFADRAVRVCNFAYGDKGMWKNVAGYAEYSYSLDARHITRARIRLNDTNSAGIEQAVTAHEIGHTLGLDHRPAADVTSCMTPIVTAGQKDPDPHDFEEVDGLHTHLPHPGTASTSLATDPDVRVQRDGDLIHVAWRHPV